MTDQQVLAKAIKEAIITTTATVARTNILSDLRKITVLRHTKVKK